MKNCGSNGSNKIKTKLACILEADESTRMCMGNSIPNHHEDHIARKVKIHFTALQLGSQVYPQAIKKCCSKSNGGQGMGKLGEIFGVELDESQK